MERRLSATVVVVAVNSYLLPLDMVVCECAFCTGQD